MNLFAEFGCHMDKIRKLCAQNEDDECTRNQGGRKLFRPPQETPTSVEEIRQYRELYGDPYHEVGLCQPNIKGVLNTVTAII